MTDQLPNVEVYAGLRADTIELVRSLTPDQAALKVPQSPAWSIRDVIAHVVGIVDDMLADNLVGIGSDSWTEAQVAQRSGRSLGAICDEWEGSAPAFAALAEANPVIPMRAGADLITHHHDILQALGRKGDRDSAAVRMGLERYGPFFCERAETAGLPTVRVEAGGQTWQSRDATPAAVLTASAFELLRAFSGRRSSAQILAMGWAGDADPYLSVVSPYGRPAEDVIE